MSLRRPFLIIFSLLVIAACIATPLIPESAQPFDGQQASSNPPTMEVLPSSVGLPMPDGLKAGDLIRFQDMPPDTRVFFMVGGMNPPAGTPMDLPVLRADGLHHVHAEFQRVSFLNGSAGNIFNELVNYALMLLTAALGLLLLWRGQSRAALGVAVWCFASIFQDFVPLMPVPLPYCAYLAWAGELVYSVGTLIGIYMVADDLTTSARPLLRRRVTTGVFAALVVAYIAGVEYFKELVYQTGALPPSGNIIIGLHFGGFAISLAVMAFSYRRCTPINQARLRWVGMSLVGLLLAYSAGIAAVYLKLPPLVLNIGSTLLQATALVGFAYAVLKHRLVSLQFVLNRALVYGLITSLVVGVFAAMLTFLEHETLNPGTNRLLTLVVPLLLGMGLNTLKRNVDSYINKIFFRHRHRAEEALAQFARTCGYVEDPEKLLDLTADELFRHGGAESLAIYLTEPNKAGAKLVRQRGADGAYTQHLDIDDLGFLRLRAGDLEVDLHGIASGLGQEGNVFAFTVRGDVMGFIVCGARPAEAYSPEERRLFALVAHQVAVALHSLRMEEEHRLLKALAEGSFTSLPTAQAKAKELIRAAN